MRSQPGAWAGTVCTRLQDDFTFINVSPLPSDKLQIKEIPFVDHSLYFLYGKVDPTIN